MTSKFHNSKKKEASESTFGSSPKVKQSVIIFWDLKSLENSSALFIGHLKTRKLMMWLLKLCLYLGSLLYSKYGTQSPSSVNIGG